MTDTEQTAILPARKRPTYWLLYTSHLIQTFGDRLLQFAAPILFTLLWTDTIFPQALYAFWTFAAIVCVMPLFGGWIDTTNRLKLITTTIIVQNLAVLLSCGCLFILAQMIDDETGSIPTFNNVRVILTFSGLLMASMVGYVMGKGATLALEKDWCYVMAKANTTELTLVNSRMKRIDLFCKIIAPGLFGIFVEYVGDTNYWKIIYGSALVFAWNAVGIFIEYGTIRALYRENFAVLSVSDLHSAKKKQKESIFMQFYNGWNYWVRSSMVFASIAYCTLFVNVLSGGPLVTAYLRFNGLSFLALGLAKGGGALFGIFGTFLTPLLTQYWSMSKISLLTIWLFFGCLMIGGSTFIYNSVTGSFVQFPPSWHISFAYLILISMITARCPLWSFDIVQGQLMQTNVQPTIRGYVNGVQMSLANLFYLSLTVMGMIFSSVGQFYILVYYDLVIVFVGCVIVSLWYAFPNKFGHDHYHNIFMPVAQEKPRPKPLNKITNK